MTAKGTPRKLGPNSTLGSRPGNAPSLVSGAALRRTAQAAMRCRCASWPVSEASRANSAASAGHRRMKSSQSSGGAGLAVLAARAGCAARSTAAVTASGAQNIARRSMVTPGASSLVSGIQVMQTRLRDRAGVYFFNPAILAPILAGGAEGPRGNTEAFAEQPTERSQAFEAYREADGGDVVTGVGRQAAGGFQARLLQKLHGSLPEGQFEHALKMEGREGGDARCRGHRKRLVVTGEQKVVAAIEAAIEFHAGGGPLAGKRLGFAAHLEAQAGQRLGQRVHAVFKPRRGCLRAAQSGIEIGERARDLAGVGAGLGVEPLAKIERRRGWLDVVQVPLGARAAARGQFQEAGLEKRAEGFGLDAAVAFELERIALAIVEDQERIRGEQVVPLRGVIARRSAHHGFERQGSAVIVDFVARAAAVQHG